MQDVKILFTDSEASLSNERSLASIVFVLSLHPLIRRVKRAWNSLMNLVFIISMTYRRGKLC